MASGYEVSYSAKSPLLDNLLALPKTYLKQSKIQMKCTNKSSSNTTYKPSSNTILKGQQPSSPRATELFTMKSSDTILQDIDGNYKKEKKKLW